MIAGKRRIITRRLLAMSSCFQEKGRKGDYTLEEINEMVHVRVLFLRCW